MRLQAYGLQVQNSYVLLINYTSSGIWTTGPNFRQSYKLKFFRYFVIQDPGYFIMITKLLLTIILFQFQFFSCTKYQYTIDQIPFILQYVCPMRSFETSNIYASTRAKDLSFLIFTRVFYKAIWISLYFSQFTSSRVFETNLLAGTLCSSKGNMFNNLL